MFFDTHAHLNFRDYDQDREEVIKKSLGDGVLMINVGTDYRESQKVIAIAEKSDGVYSAVGLHPLHIDEEDFFLLINEYRELIKNEKVVAIGETGLDYKYIKNDSKIQKKQKKVLEKHIDFMNEFDLPLILHCRMAHQDLLKILKPKTEKLKGVVHCFSGNLKELEDYLDLGFYIGLNGIIFKLSLEEVIKEAPLERVLLETDCPFLVPPMAGRKRNEPVFVKHVAQEVARIKQISEEEVARVTTENAKKLFLSNLKG